MIALFHDTGANVDFGWLDSTAGAVIFKLVYGHQVQYDNDPYVNLAASLSRITSEASAPGKWMVDSFPLCESSDQHVRIVFLKLLYSATCTGLVWFPTMGIESQKGCVEIYEGAP